MTFSVAWRLVLAIVLVVAVVVSACARAPRTRTSAVELGRLVVCALVLYAIGVIATLSGRPVLAAIVDGSGIATAALAAWLSRGRDQEDPPGGGGLEEPVNPSSPPQPGGAPWLDWARFERDFREYARCREQQRPRVR